MTGRLSHLPILALLLALLACSATAAAQTPGEIRLAPIKNGDEVLLRLPGGQYIAPDLQTIGGDQPRLILDFKGVKSWEKAEVSGTQGKVIRNVRAYLYEQQQRLKVVFDLAYPPDKVLASLGYDTDAYGTYFTLRAVLPPRHR